MKGRLLSILLIYQFFVVDKIGTKGGQRKQSCPPFCMILILVFNVWRYTFDPFILIFLTVQAIFNKTDLGLL